MNQPLVSCVCLTYNRPQLLEESIQCFLDQTYPNKELLIVNDNPLMTLEYRAPQVTVYNVSKRFTNLGAKYNWAMLQVKGDLVCIWEDDDLYGINRIADSVRLFDYGYDLIKPRNALVSINNGHYSIQSNLFHSQSCFSIDFVRSNRFALRNFGIDYDYEVKAQCKYVEVEPLFWYIYRWGNVQHLSAIPEESSWNTLVDTTKYGTVRLCPQYHRMYPYDIALFYKVLNIQYYHIWTQTYARLLQRQVVDTQNNYHNIYPAF